MKNKTPFPANIPKSDETLLCYAMMMLTLAQSDQVNKKRNQTWLIDNETLKVIQARVDEIKKANET